MEPETRKVPISKEFTVFCDVDKTLIKRFIPAPSPGALEWCPSPSIHINHAVPHLEGRYIVLESNVKILLEYKHRGYSIIIWSARGSEWAKLVSEAIGVHEIVDFYLAKPTKYIDDKHASEFMGEPIFFTDTDL